MIKPKILFEDKHILVAVKPQGIATQTAKASSQDMVSILKNYRASKGEDTYIGLVHRLDQPVGGVMVFAKTKVAAGKLSSQLSGGGFNKRYYAAVEGILENEGKLTDYLLKDGKTNMSEVVAEGTKDSKKAVLSYKVLGNDPLKNTSLVDIHLETGRHHQIRVQFSHAGYPLCGDTKYGTSARGLYRNICLYSYTIGFDHPVTGKRMEFQDLPSLDKWGKFS